METRTKLAATFLALGLAVTPMMAAKPDGAGRHHRGAGMLQGRGFERMATALNLTETQKQFATQLREDTKRQAQPIVEELRKNRQAYADAVKGNNESEITRLSQRNGDLMGQLSALRGKALASFQAQLTPEQKQKAEELRTQARNRANNWKGRRGQAPNAQQQQ